MEGTAESGLSCLRSAGGDPAIFSWLHANSEVKIGAFVEHPVLHHPPAAANVVDLFGWISFHEYKVGSLSRGNGAQVFSCCRSRAALKVAICNAFAGGIPTAKVALATTPRRTLFRQPCFDNLVSYTLTFYT